MWPARVRTLASYVGLEGGELDESEVAWDELQEEASAQLQQSIFAAEVAAAAGGA